MKYYMDSVGFVYTSGNRPAIDAYRINESPAADEIIIRNEIGLGGEMIVKKADVVELTADEYEFFEKYGGYSRPQIAGQSTQRVEHYNCLSIITTKWL